MTRQVDVKGLKIGGGAPVSVQSMTNTDTRDVAATQAQIDALESAGCQLARVSVYDEACALALSRLKCTIPVCADVHFDHRLAIAAIESGADKLRINPGNIGPRKNVQAVADCARANCVPIRIGVNMGSLQREAEQKYGRTPEAMVESAISHIALLEREHFYDIVVSLKASDVQGTVRACRLFSQRSDYPLHIGVTEAGAGEDAVIKSAAGIGALLIDGIGDTLRVSMTGDPVREVETGLAILRALRLRGGLEVISCPTCGRTTVDLETKVSEIKTRLPSGCNLRIAVMGCVVNGPGEAKDADLGVAFAPNGAALFKKGALLRKVDRDAAVDELLKEIDCGI